MKKTKEAKKKLTPAQARAKLNRSIAASNEDFAALSAPKKRVQIARDVLAQLRVGRGSWITFEPNEKFAACEGEVRDNTLKLKTCMACQLGSLFLCAVERADKLQITELALNRQFDNNVLALTETDIYLYLGRFFDSDQLALMEYAFESDDRKRGMRCRAQEKNPDRYDMFVDLDVTDYSGTPAQRMRTIMRNVIANGGVFVP